MAQVVIFTDLIEVERWDNYGGDSLPSPWAWEVGSYLRYRSSTTHLYDWYKRNLLSYGWTFIDQDAVPKALHLLTLLE